MSPGPATQVSPKAPVEPPPGATSDAGEGTPTEFDDALRSAQGAAGRDAAERGQDGDKPADTAAAASAAATESTALPAASAPAPPATDAPIVIDVSLLAGTASTAPRPEGRVQPAEAGRARGLPAAQPAPAALPVDAEPNLAVPAPSTSATPTREAPGEAAAALREFSRQFLRAAEPVAPGMTDRVDAALPQPAESAESRAPAAFETAPAPARPAAVDVSVTAPAVARQESAAPPARLAIEAPVGTARFIDQAAQRVTWMARNGVEHAEIRVRPAELGPITVRIELSNNEVLVNFAVTQPDTRVAVEDALHRLEEMLAENGLAMSGANVGGQGFGSGESASPAQTPAQVNSGPSGDRGQAERAGSARAAHKPRGLVDTFA